MRNTNVGSVYVSGLESSAGDTIGVHLANTFKKLELDNWYMEWLSQLLYDDSGFGGVIRLGNDYFNVSNIVPDQFYTVGNSQPVSTSNTWGVSGETLKLYVALPNKSRTNAGKLSSNGDQFSDAQGMFTPYSSTGNYSINLTDPVGLSGTGNNGSITTAYAQKLGGPLEAPTLWGGMNSYGRLGTTKIGTISAPTATPTCTGTCATNNTYYLVCYDRNGGSTAVSAGGTPSSGSAAPLSATNYDTITWPYYPGCASFDVYANGTSGSHLLASGVTQTAQISGQAAYQVLDIGQALSSKTAPTVDTTGDLPVAGNVTFQGGTGIPFTIGWDGYLGIVTSAATKTLVAPCTGHFTSLSCDAALTGTCTTPPTINVGDVTGSTTGTAINLTTTVGTPVTQSQTLTFTSGDVIGLEQTATPGTCTTPWWGCVATMTCP